MTRSRPHASVSKWLDDADDNRLYFSVVSLGEILKGLTVLPEGKRRTELQQWLDEVLRPWFLGRILPVNERVAERWGVLSGQCRLRGRPLKVADGFIAAPVLGVRPDPRNAQRERLRGSGPDRLQSLGCLIIGFLARFRAGGGGLPLTQHYTPPDQK